MDLNKDELEVIQAVKYYPSVSILLFVETVIGLKAELQYKVKMASETVRRELQKNYPDDICKAMEAKLEEQTAAIDYDKVSKSLAIYVSPLLSKVFYLNLPIEEKIIVDDSFEIRDLIYATQESSKYIALLLSGTHAKAFLVDNSHMIKLALQTDDIAALEGTPAEPVANFSDPTHLKEVMQDKFLRGVDRSLTTLLKSYNLPVALLGTDRVLGHYKSITANAPSITSTIHGNYLDATPTILLQALKLHTDALKEHRRQSILEELERAAGAKKLETGVKASWTAAYKKQGRLLVVEKNFIYPADHTATAAHIRKHDEETPMPFHIKDAVDDIIEMVINSGGTVQFVEKGVLDDYEHIALIRYY